MRLNYTIKILLISCGLTLGATDAFASTAPDCEAMAIRMGKRAGLPDGLLPTISRIEAGRTKNGKRRAWPWTLNHAGNGLYFDSRTKAFAYLKKTVDGGWQNIDVGCMQINVRWHRQNFDSLSEMLEPSKNIAYAITFLKELHQRTGSWTEAVKHYHSPNPKLGARYHKRYQAALEHVASDTKSGRLVASSAANSGPARVDFAGAGLFGGQNGQTSQPLIRDVAMTAAPIGEYLSSQDTMAAYAKLLDVLAKADGNDMPIAPMPVELAKKAPQGELRRRWSDVETFRNFFKSEAPG